MQIQDILSSEQSDYISSLTRKSEKDSESSNSTPLSWSADTVSISPEALAAQQASPTVNQNEQSAEEGEEDATAAFGEFMAKARGEKTSSDPSEQLEALKSKLTQLQSKKAEVLSSPELPEETKLSQASAIDGQINQIVSQIAELESQMAQNESEATEV